MTAILYCQMQKLSELYLLNQTHNQSESSLVLWFNPRLYTDMRWSLEQCFISREQTQDRKWRPIQQWLLSYTLNINNIQNKNLSQSCNTFVYSIQDDPGANLSTKVRIFFIIEYNYEPILIARFFIHVTKFRKAMQFVYLLHYTL